MNEDDEMCEWRWFCFVYTTFKTTTENLVSDVNILHRDTAIQSRSILPREQTRAMMYIRW